MGNHAPFAAATGYGQQRGSAASLAVGFHHRLIKPVDPPVLLRLLEAAADADTAGSALDPA